MRLRPCLLRLHQLLAAQPTNIHPHADWLERKQTSASASSSPTDWPGAASQPPATGVGSRERACSSSSRALPAAAADRAGHCIAGALFFVSFFLFSSSRSPPHGVPGVALTHLLQREAHHAAAAETKEHDVLRSRLLRVCGYYAQAANLWAASRPAAAARADTQSGWSCRLSTGAGTAATSPCRRDERRPVRVVGLGMCACVCQI